MNCIIDYDKIYSLLSVRKEKEEIVVGPMIKKSENASRKTIYDVLKGLGIISIVIGHTHPSGPVLLFVYSYHLALFVFVSGLQFNTEKYSDNPYLLFQNRVRTMWPAYFLYLTFFTLIHNIAMRLHMIPEEELYGEKMIFDHIWDNFVFRGYEPMGGILWFVPVLLITLVVFGIVVYFSFEFFYKVRVACIVIACCSIGISGMYCNLNDLGLNMHIHTGLLLMPVLMLGFLISYLRIDFEKLFRWYIAIPCAILVYWLVVVQGYQIELSVEYVGSALVFYPITICGIYFMCYIGHLINRFPKIAGVFAHFGKYSFDIMALHLFVIKLIDICFGTLIGDTAENISKAPCAYDQLWFIYLIASLVISPCIRICISKSYSYIKLSIQQHNR